MFPSNTIYSCFLICQVCVGVMGNLALCVFYCYTFLIQPRLKKPIDVIFMHLTVANILTIVFTLMPYLLSSSGVRIALNDIGCKSVLYIFRVARGLSICTTSLLSAFQAITVSPSWSKWAWLKSKLSVAVLPSLLFFWVVNMLVYIYIIDVIGTRSNTTIAGYSVHAHCQARQLVDSQFENLFIGVIMFRDGFFVALMMGTSLYMASHLYKHRRRARCLHRSSLSSQTPPESRAIHTILLLVGCFVFLYCSNNLFTLYLLYTPRRSPRLEGIGGILSACYPTICPFLLMKNNKMLSRLSFCLSMVRTILFQSLRWLI